jgi:hypothetical protein
VNWSEGVHEHWIMSTPAVSGQWFLHSAGLDRRLPDLLGSPPPVITHAIRRPPDTSVPRSIFKASAVGPSRLDRRGEAVEAAVRTVDLPLAGGDEPLERAASPIPPASPGDRCADLQETAVLGPVSKSKLTQSVTAPDLQTLLISTVSCKVAIHQGFAAGKGKRTCNRSESVMQVRYQLRQRPSLLTPPPGEIPSRHILPTSWPHALYH